MDSWWVIPSIIVSALAVGALIFRVGKWVGSVESDRKDFREFIKEVRDDIKEILGRLPPSSVARGSPLQLTDLGRSISETLSAREWAEKTASAIADRAQDKQPYEIQEFCFDYIKKEFSPAAELETRIGMCAYENGIDRDEVLNVLAIELRDVLMGTAG